MLMTWIWFGMAALSLLWGSAAGTLPAVSAAVTEGAAAAVSLCIGIAGAVCLWSGVMEVMAQSGMLGGLTELLRPLLRRLYPAGFRDRECGDAIALNFAANLLGLGNAATPAGLRAVSRMADGSGIAGDELCRFVVLNTASLQFIPATVAAVRGSLGAAQPFDILPCVWVTSLCSAVAGLATAAILARLFPA